MNTLVMFSPNIEISTVIRDETNWIIFFLLINKMDVNATFDQIAQLIRTKNYTDLGSVPELQHLASEGNIIFTVVDKSGNRFTAEVYYNPETGDLQPPLLQQIPYLTGLPPPVLIDVAIEMSLPDILRMCRTNKYLNDNICGNNDFWRKKFIHDFGIEGITVEEEKMMATPNYWKRRYEKIGKVWSFGNNEYGQLGLGNHGFGTEKNEPTSIDGIPSAKAISAGKGHSILLAVNGDVWVSGNNENGQLGLRNHGFGTDKDKPVMIRDIPLIKAISAGGSYSLLLDIKGDVWAFGNNGRGQLGLGDGLGRNKPTLITGIPPIKAISAGGAYSLLLDTFGKVWSSGYNYYGQLGLGKHGDGADMSKPTLITNIPLIKAISAGLEHSLLLDVNGGIWSVGDNYFGQLGLGDHTNRDKFTLITGIPPIKAISAGEQHSLLLDVDDSIWSFGTNRFGQLGLGNQGFETGIHNPTLITGISLIKDISAGGNHSSLLDINGNVWSFGGNTFGQLGLGFRGLETDKDKPVMIRDIPLIKTISAGSSYSLLISY